MRIFALSHATVVALLALALLSGHAQGAGRNIYKEARRYATGADTYLDNAFVHTTDYLENLYLDSSMNPQYVDPAPFKSGIPDSEQCFNITTHALQYGAQVNKKTSEYNVEEGGDGKSNHLRDLPLDDSDNMHRSGVQSMEMVRRKMRIWNEETRESIPVRCISDKSPYTVEMSRAQKRKYKLLCVTFTYNKKHGKTLLVNKGWGRRCYRHIAITNKDDGLSEKFEGGKKNVIELTPKGGEGYGNMWQKTRATLEYFKRQQQVRRAQDEAAAKKKGAAAAGSGSEKDEILNQGQQDASQGGAPNMQPGDEVFLEDYDYIFFGGDDVIVVPENLHRMINEPTLEGMHESGVPLHFGYRSITVTNSPFISGAGYVLNSVALRLMSLVALNDHEHCSPNLHASAEDVYLALCLQNALGVVSRDTRDAFGEDRFNILSVDMLMWVTEDIAFSWWWRDYRDRPVPRGFNIMSRDSILIHYLQTDQDFIKWTKAIYGTAE